MERLDAFTHANQPKAHGITVRLFAKAFAIVAHRDRNHISLSLPRAPRYGDRGTGSGSMSCHISQTFLNDPVHGDIKRLSHPVQLAIQTQIASYVRMPFAPRCNGIPQGFTQPQMIQCGGTELPDYAVHYIVNVGSNGYDGHCIGMSLRLAVLCSICYRRSNGLDRRNTLPQFIVQFPRNSSTFFLQATLYCTRQLTILLQFALGKLNELMFCDVTHAAYFANHLIACWIDQR